MLLDALATIGDELGDLYFESTYLACCDPDELRGNQAIESVVEIEFLHQETKLAYQGIRLVDPMEPLEMATRYGYANQYNQYDHSLTQRVRSSLLTEFDQMKDWPTDDAIGDSVDDPFVQSLAAAFDHAAPAIREDLGNYEDSIEYRALLSIRIIEPDGTVRYPGEIDVLCRGTFNAYRETLETSSGATGSKGTTSCAVCDTQTTTYGLGAKFDYIYTLKKQWPFPEYNASLSWQARPLCAGCIRKIETALKLFIDKQEYGAPGIRCRVIPYSIPVDGAEERLRSLIRAGHEELTDKESQQPLSAAWEQYKREVEILGDEDPLRLSFIHYIKDSNKAHGVASIDGVSVDQVNALKSEFEAVLETHPLFQQEPFTSLTAPHEKQLFTGTWLYRLLGEVSDSDHEDNPIGDNNRWAECTETLLVGTPIRQTEFVGGVVREALARYRQRSKDEETEEHPFDGFHIAIAFAFQRTCARLDLLTNSHTAHTMTTEPLTGEYVTLGDGLIEFIDAHDSINESPGRTAAFVLGAVAAQLSAWQIRRGLNRTFVQNRDVAHLSTENLSTWETAIWSKATTYNAQNGNYGTPWRTAQERFHEAVLQGENEGWHATKDDLKYHYILGVTFGPKIATQASENWEAQADEQDQSEPTTTPDELVGATDAALEH